MVFTVKESSGDTAAWLRTHAGGKAGSKLVLMEPEDPLRQCVVVQVLVMNEAYQNVSFSGELEDGVSGSEGERVAPQGIPPALQAVFPPQVPSEKPAATHQEVASEVCAPLSNVDAEELNSGGRHVLSGPGKNECIPLVERAQRWRAAGAGSATPEADPVGSPEAAIEAFFQLSGHVALPEPAVDARILLEDEAVVTATFVALFGDEEAELFTPEEGREDGPGAEDEEAL